MSDTMKNTREVFDMKKWDKACKNKIIGNRWENEKLLNLEGKK